MKRIKFTKQFKYLTLFAWREEHKEIIYYSSPAMHSVFLSQSFICPSWATVCNIFMQLAGAKYETEHG